MSCVDFEKLTAAMAEQKPFPHLSCPDFIRAEDLDAIHRDFPAPPGAGSFPLSTLRFGSAFARLIDSIRGPRMAEILAAKLDAPLIERPTMVTVRGFCRETDGAIHLDSGGKLATVLLYLNREWDAKAGGRLRLLRGGGDIDDYFFEAAPGDGALLAFRCDDNAWHGHLPFAGERRAIQLNWAKSRAYCRREAARHFLSATVKKARASFSRRAA